MNLTQLLDLEKYPTARPYGAAEYDLEGFRRWLDSLGRPQENLRFLHIAGTKGKGSAAAIAEGLLRAAGFPTALFSSPHLEHYGERYRFDGTAWTAAEFTARLKEFDARLTPAQRTGLEGPQPFRTVFEVLTALALDAFRRRQEELAAASAEKPLIVLWETGLGGRLDCTNVVMPLVSVITVLGMDHTAILGNTIEQIAAEKAGIIKPARPVVLARQPEEFRAAASAVVERTALEREARLYKAEEFTPVLNAAPLAEGQEVTLRLPTGGEVRAVLPLNGIFQRHNLEAALAAVWLACEESGVALGAECIARGLRLVNWPGRMEIWRGGGRTLVLDGAHCPLSARALAESIVQRGLMPLGLVFSMQRDKDHAAFLRAFCGALPEGSVKEIAAFSPGGPRGADAATLAEAARPHGIAATPFAHAGAALNHILTRHNNAAAAGTLYTPAQLRRHWQEWLATEGSTSHARA